MPENPSPSGEPAGGESATGEPAGGELVTGEPAGGASTTAEPASGAPATPGDRPARRVGPEALKALTHPLRMRMWDYLRDHTSATATELARVTGESTGQTSYHLRQLERYGFVEDDPDKPAGRERWWRAVGFQVTPEELLDDAMRTETLALLRGHLASRAAFQLNWIERHRDEPREWLDASTSAETSVRMTAAELKALTDELEEVLTRHARAAKAAKGDGAERRIVRVSVDALPVPPDPRS